MAQLKVAIVGCGRMGRERARCAHQAGARISAVYDLDAGRADALAAQWETRVLASEDEFVESGVDAVFLCTPPDTHGPLALAAIRAGMAFLVEKPVAASRDAGDRVEAELARWPVLNAVGYMNRYRASIQLARRLLSGKNVLGMCGYWVCKKYTVPWWLNPASSGGPLNEQATHLFDIFRFLVGEIACVESILSTPSNEDLSLGAAVSLRFESGALGTIYYSCEASAKDIGARIFTSEGSIALAGWDFQLVENSIHGTVPSAQPEDIFAVETTAFLESVRTGRRDLIASDWLDAMKTQRVIEAARQCGKVMV